MDDQRRRATILVPPAALALLLVLGAGCLVLGAEPGRTANQPALPFAGCPRPRQAPSTQHRAPRAERVPAEIRVAPFPGTGEKAPPPEFLLRLANDRGEAARQVRSRDGVALVPAGQYWLTGWTVTTTDAAGHTWKARGGVLGMPSPRTRLPLRAGQKLTLRLAAPLGVSVSPIVRGRTVALNMAFTGALGDRCYEVERDNGRPPRPVLKIVDAQGREVDRLDFAFGCSFLCMLSWRAPEGVSGSFRAVPEVDFGPFAVVPGKPASFEIAANAGEEDPLANGRTAPEFVLPEPEQGTTLSLSNLRGRPVILNFFCGCAWCEAVAGRWGKTGTLPGDPEVIAILNDPSLATPAGVRRFRDRTGFKGRVLADPERRTTLLYSSSECPRVWVLDADGTIRHVNASRTEPPDRILAEATATLATLAGAGAAVP